MIWFCWMWWCRLNGYQTCMRSGKSSQSCFSAQELRWKIRSWGFPAAETTIFPSRFPIRADQQSKSPGARYHVYQQRLEDTGRKCSGVLGVSGRNCMEKRKRDFSDRYGSFLFSVPLWSTESRFFRNTRMRRYGKKLIITGGKYCYGT